LIHIEHLHKVYGNPAQAALADVSLHIPRGRIFGLLGPNGAGKTTLISILSGILPKTRGRVTVDGLDLDRQPEQIKRLLGLVPQELAFYPMLTAKENLDFYAGVIGLRGAARRERIERSVEAADLGKHLKRRAHQFSGGLKRRLNLAIGLLNEPRVLILDEPTVGIDPQSRHFILQSLLQLREAGVTVIYTSHYLEEVQQICDEIAIIDHGKILLSGTLEALLKSAGANLLSVELDRPLDASLRRELEAALEQPLQVEGPATLSLNARLDTLERLLAATRERGVQVRNLRYGAQDLERVFLRLTSTSLRD
jgi:ABC-2 type transport system ATP-binding protein